MLLVALLTCAHIVSVAPPDDASFDPETFTAGTMDLVWTRPKLNASACDAAGAAVAVTIRGSNGRAGSDLHIWFQEGKDCTLTQLPSGSAVLAQESNLVATHPLIDSSDFRFPNDVDDSRAKDFDTTKVLEQAQACGATAASMPAEGKYFALCFGLNLPTGLDGSVDTKFDATEPYGVAVLLVDTKAPAGPGTPRVKALDGRLELLLAVADAPADLAGYLVRHRPAQEPFVDDCTLWNERTYDEKSSASDTVAIDVTNGVLHEACAYSLDLADNRGGPSPVVRAIGHDECDFMECYPDDVRTGFCDAGGGTAIWLALLSVLCVTATRRKNHVG